MEALAWMIIVSFVIFGVCPGAGILFSRDRFITYQEALGFGFVLLCGLVLAIGCVASLAWAVGVVPGHA